MKKMFSVCLIMVLMLLLVGCKSTSDALSDDLSVITVVETETETVSADNSSKTEKPPKKVVGEYTVTFDYAHDNKISTAKSKDYRVASPADATRAGYECLGWYTADQDLLWDFAIHDVTEDMTLIAKWEKCTYSIKYTNIVNGVQTNVLKEKIGNSPLENIVAMPLPWESTSTSSESASSESKQKFEWGVYIEFDKAPVDMSNKDVIANMTSSEKELHWFYEFYYPPVPKTFDVDSETFTIPELQYEGFEFLGWTHEGQTTPVKTVTIPKGTTQNLNLVANWQSQ